MKTKEEILELYTGSDYYKLVEFLPYVVDAMQEYATQQTEVKDREIEEMKVLLRKAMTEMYYSNPNETEIKTLITNYLNRGK